MRAGSLVFEGIAGRESKMVTETEGKLYFVWGKGGGQEIQYQGQGQVRGIHNRVHPTGSRKRRITKENVIDNIETCYQICLLAMLGVCDFVGS